MSLILRAGLLLSLACCLVPSAEARAMQDQAAPRTVDDTLAFEMFRLERRHRRVSGDVEARLRTVLRDAYASLGTDPRPPRSRDEFLRFAQTVSRSLAAHNLIQPVARADWQESLGSALEEVAPADGRVQRYLADEQNRARLPYIDRSRPFHFVDCDMGALLIISVAQLVGFDLRLVEVPDHNFVRWQDGRGASVNWDWTNWASLDDAEYRRRFDISDAQVNRGVWLASQTPGQTRGYYMTALSRLVPDWEGKLALIRDAIRVAGNVSMVTNNAGWLFATVPAGVEPGERLDAVRYALPAWANAPDDPIQMETTACAFAARGDRDLAVPILQRAIRLAGDSHRSINRLRGNLELVGRDELCATSWPPPLQSAK